MRPIFHDASCGWTNTTDSPDPRPSLSGHHQCDWLIVGAGYTGLSAARRLEQQQPQARICLIDAGRLGQGASTRNSGYLVDSTLNDGHLSDTGLQTYRSKLDVNLAGIAAVERFASQSMRPLKFERIGKLHAARSPDLADKLQNFQNTLTQCGLTSDWLEGNSLRDRLGSDYYSIAVQTQGAIMVQPADLAFAMVEALTTTQAFEYTQAKRWTFRKGGWRVETNDGTIDTKHLILCGNGHLRDLGHQRVYPLWLTASLTRPLTDQEWDSLGRPLPWGLLSAQAMGATVRLTAEKRLMIRNTVQVNRPLRASSAQLALMRKHHQTGLSRRFPTLPPMIEHTWGGVTGISTNNASVFERLPSNLYRAGCYNGGGIGLATLFGEAIVDYALGNETDDIQKILQRPNPGWMPPEPALSAGVWARLTRDRYRAR